MWPDDPQCLMFKDNPDNNMDYDGGVDWLSAYKSDTSLTGISHHGFLSFFHGMSRVPDETASTTKAGIMTWLEVLYRLAVEDLSGHALIKDTELADLLSQVSDLTKLQTTTLRNLLTCGHRGPADVRNRALGAALHLVEDSFCHSHISRVLLNPEDNLADSEGKLSPGLKSMNTALTR